MHIYTQHEHRVTFYPVTLFKETESKLEKYRKILSCQVIRKALMFLMSAITKMKDSEKTQLKMNFNYPSIWLDNEPGSCLQMPSHLNSPCNSFKSCISPSLAKLTGTAYT